MISLSLSKLTMNMTCVEELNPVSKEERKRGSFETSTHNYDTRSYISRPSQEVAAEVRSMGPSPDRRVRNKLNI